MNIWEHFFTRKYDLSLPLGDIHQIHGTPPYKREVFMTVAQQDKASRLICGITIGEPGNGQAGRHINTLMTWKFIALLIFQRILLYNFQ